MSCANIAAPTGGPKDVSAPVLKHRSMQDSALNFKGGKIQYEFDEFLQIKDIENQLSITPLLAHSPKITIHKRKATIYIADSLLMPNTTYQINLGNAIQDMHEGNPVKNLSFTFSTGSYFDSLTIQGAIFQAETGFKDTASWIVLYPMPVKDSAFTKQKPMYAQKSNQGVFQFKNLPNKDFKIYSLQETNNNLKFDADGERVSFYPKVVNASDSNLFVTLYSFIEKQKIDTNTKQLGRKTTFNAATKNTAFIYTINIDTLQKAKRTFDINDSIVISLSDSILEIDKSKIRLFQNEDFDATVNIRIDSSKKKIILKTEWVQDANYTLSLLKSFAENNQKIQATASSFHFKTKKENDYGTLTLTTTKDDKKIITLLKDNKEIATQKASDTLLKFALLSPGNYQIKILYDNNKNGVWDSGNLYEKQMPEVVKFLPEIIAVKANWANKIEVNDEEPKRKLKRLRE